MNQIGQEINANADAAQQAQQAAGTAQSTADDAQNAANNAQTTADNAQQTVENHIADKDNPHGTTKAQIGLGKVKDAEQATKTEFDNHVDDHRAHGATYENEPSAIMRRDSLGRASVSNPTQNDHIANKGYTDQQIQSATANTAKTNQSVAFDGDVTSKGSQIVMDSPDGQNPHFVLKVDNETVGMFYYSIPSEALVMRVYNPVGTGYKNLLMRFDGTFSFDGGNVWHSLNLPDPAREDRANTFKRTQLIELDNTNSQTALRLRSTGIGSDFGLAMRPDGKLGLWDYIASRTLIYFGANEIEVPRNLVVGNQILSGSLPSGQNQLVNASASSNQIWVGNPDTTLKFESLSEIMAYITGIGNVTFWHNGNQGNPNNLNTSSKQVVGAIDELFTTVSNGKQAIRDAIADNGGTPPTGSPNQYTHQQLANAVSTVSKYKSGTTPSQTNVQIRGIPFEVDVFTFFYQTSDDGGITVLFTDVNSPFIRKTNTTAADPVITRVSGGFNLTLDRPAGTNMTWEAWGGRD